MNAELVNRIAQAVLYEGYILYPYRRSALKNQQRWNFGVLYPPNYAQAQTGNDAWSMQSECLALVNPDTGVNVSLRFLHLVEREIGKLKPDSDQLSYERVDSLEVGAERFQSWQEAREREVSVPMMKIQELEESPQTFHFSFPAAQTVEPLRDEDRVAAVIVRRNEAVAGEVSLSAQRESGSLYKLRVIANNGTEFTDDEHARELALGQSLLSAHLVISLENGEFISLLDPPEEFRSSAAACGNIGCWPVLVGAEGERDTMLASPIILYDYPQVAPESSGDLFDATEIDEILTLRIMTLTEDEKLEMQISDARARQILERTESLPGEQFLKMHGALRHAR